MTSKRLCFALDLKNDPELIQQYIEHHQSVWPEIIESIQQSGIINMEIYQVRNRLFMMVDAQESFSLEVKSQLDKDNEVVNEWEALMSKYQQVLPFASKGEKWVLMERIFKL